MTFKVLHRSHRYMFHGFDNGLELLVQLLVLRKIVYPANSEAAKSMSFALVWLIFVSTASITKFFKRTTK